MVLESGLGGTTETWSSVLPDIVAQNRLCTYNRAGIAPSDLPRSAPSADDMVSDLDALLTTAHVPPPYVLVGFSFGGLVAQLYAREHAADVAGLVLVESNHPDDVDQFEAHLTAAQIRRDHAFVEANGEGADVFASFRDVQLADHPLPNVPLVVVTAGRSEGWPAGWDARLFDRLRAQQQADLVTMVPGGRQLVAGHSGHDVPLDQPEVVVRAVEMALEQSR